MTGTTATLPSGIRPVLRAVATSVVPESASLTAREWAEVEVIIAGALSARPAAVGRRVAAFLRLLDLAPIARHGRRLTRLAPDRRTAFLEAVARSPILTVRRGMWGVRTLVLMGYYARPSLHEELGYRARAGGWSARGGTIATVPLRLDDVVVEPS